MNRSMRAVRRLNEAVSLIEMLMVRKGPLTNRALERMLADIHRITRRMQRMDISNTKSGKRYWQMSKRALRLCIQAVNILTRV